MRVPPYAKFVLAIFAGLVVCGGYITGADLLCPVEKQGPLSIDDLQVYQRPQRENQARNQRDNQGISQKSRSIGSIFTPLQANAEQPPTKGQSDDKNHQPRKWVSIVCDVKLADIVIAFLTYCLVLVTGWLVRATIGLQDVTAELVRHGTISDRAHVSGGANRAQTQTGEQFLVVTVNNYEASPAFIGTIAATVCEKSDLDLPLAPTWQKTEWKGYVFGSVAGQQTDVVLPVQIDKVIIGRIWYRDIFKNCHSAGFALEINGLRAVGKGSYWEDRDENDLGPAEPPTA